MVNGRLLYLLDRHRLGNMTAGEREELRALTDDNTFEASAEGLSVYLQQQEYTPYVFAEGEVAVRLQAILDTDRLHQLNRSVHREHFLKKWGWAAAAIILVLGTGAYFLTTNKKSAESPVAALAPADIAPGRNGAVLTLSDGSQVVLDSLSDGVIASQNGTRVVLENGEVVYDPGGRPASEVTYNTMTTPKGRLFRIVLPDGTNVWLNAASSIRYPTAFTGKERKVWVTGEVYFEVIAQVGRPFSVSVDGKADIEVLGTSFNINAYNNEAQQQTTLVEGSIRVSSNASAESFVLKPGEQLQIARSQKAVIKRANLSQVLAWKNGFFNFEGMKLRDVMRQLERWYEIEVVYEKEIPDITFWGEIPKDISLSGVLAALEKTDVHFRIEGRKVIVMP